MNYSLAMNMDSVIDYLRRIQKSGIKSKQEINYRHVLLDRSRPPIRTLRPSFGVLYSTKKVAYMPLTNGKTSGLTVNGWVRWSDEWSKGPFNSGQDTRHGVAKLRK